MVADLQTLALEVYRLCIRNNISLCSAWVPRDMNQAADALSKTIDPDDWGISEHIFFIILLFFYFFIFLYFQKTIGVFTLDVFANHHNKKCVKFYSRWWCEGSSGIDAFCQSWENNMCWIVPPPSLLAKTVLFCLKHKVNGVLIIPKWKPATYWPLLFPHGKLLKEFKILQEFRKPNNFFVPGLFKNSIFANTSFSGDIMVLKVHN
jgi:hypothetical protein